MMTPTTPGSRQRKRVKINISRPIYTEKDFRKGYNPIEDERSWTDVLKEKVREIEITPQSAWSFTKRLIPVIEWLPKYNILHDGPYDFMAGLTVAIMRIPQELAYAILATLPAVYGLYTAFFPVLLYAILGTSRHISIGAQAIISIMVGVAVDSIVEKTKPIGTTLSPGSEALNEEQLRIEIAISLCLLVGFIQVFMGVFRLGFVTIYLSEPLVNGFIAGASFQVLFGSQFPKMFGISVKVVTGPFSIIHTYQDFFLKLSQTNVCALIISILTLLMLVLINEVNDWQAYKAWCRRPGRRGKRVPIPSELFVVVIATLVSDLGKYESKYNLSVVGKITTGLPSPVIPEPKYFGDLMGNAIAIAIVGFAIAVSMAQMFSTKHNYDLDSNQELIAYGSCHIFGSFFQCIPQTASMSRTAVQEGSGGRTQIVGVVSSLVVMVTLLWIAPLLSALPECVLAVIIAVSLRGMFRNFQQLPTLWKVSFIDFLLFTVSFIAVVLLDVDLGLVVSLGFAFLTLVVRTQRPYCVLMGRVKQTDIYKDISDIEEAEEIPGIKIFRCSSSPCFVNAEYLKSELYKKVGVNPQHVLIAREEARKKRALQKRDEEQPLLEESIFMKNSDERKVRLQAVIIECGMFNYVDVVGIKTLQNIASYYKKIGVHVGFSNCKGPVRRALLFSSEIDDGKKIGLDRMYLSVHDAVLNCLHKNPKTPYGSRAGSRPTSRGSSFIDSNCQTPPMYLPPASPTPTVLHQVMRELEERAEEINQQQQGNLSISVCYEDSMYNIPESIILDDEIDPTQPDIDSKEQESEI